MICLILSMMAGLRDLNIGTDTESYYNDFLYISKSYNTVDDLINDDMGFDFGFLVINWLIGRISNGALLFLFIIQLITVAFLYAGYVRLSKHYQSSLLIFTSFYLFLVYNYSFNALRQECAISIVFFAFSYLQDRKVLKYIIWTILALSIHSSVVVSFLILIVYYITLLDNPWVRKLAIVTLIGSIACTFFSFFILLEFFSNLSFLNNTLLLRYGSDSVFESTSRIGIIPSIFVIMIYSIVYISYKKKILNKRMIIFHFIMNSLYFMTLFLSLYNMFLYRLGLYFYIISLYFLSVELKSKSIPSFQKSIVLLYVFLIWVYQYIICNMSETVPYSSKILGF